MIHVNGNKKKTQVEILVADEIVFKTKTVTKDKEGTKTKGSIQQEDIIFVNIYVYNIGTPKYIKQILTDIMG